MEIKSWKLAKPSRTFFHHKLILPQDFKNNTIIPVLVITCILLTGLLSVTDGFIYIGCGLGYYTGYTGYRWNGLVCRANMDHMGYVRAQNFGHFSTVEMWRTSKRLTVPHRTINAKNAIGNLILLTRKTWY